MNGFRSFWVTKLENCTLDTLLDYRCKSNETLRYTPEALWLYQRLQSTNQSEHLEWIRYRRLSIPFVGTGNIFVNGQQWPDYPSIRFASSVQQSKDNVLAKCFRSLSEWIHN